MGYSGLLVRQWSTRDRLAVLGIALVVTMVVGSTVLLSTAGAQTTRIAGQAGSNVTVDTYESVSAARSQADIVVPYATMTVAGSEYRVVGIPEKDRAGRDIGLPTPPPRGTIVAPTALQGGTVTIADAGSFAVESGADTGPFPDSWVVARAEMVSGLGPDGAYGFERNAPGAGAVPKKGTPLVSALAFFVGGTNDLLAAVWPLAAGAAVLCAVVVFSVTRRSVRDRRPTIHVLRATGAPPRRILGIYVARAGLQTAVAVALGYAVGVVAVNGVTNAATFLGLPTTLDPTVSVRVLSLVGPIFVGLVLVGMAAGGTAAWPAMRAPPASLLGRYGGTGSSTTVLPRPTIGTSEKARIGGVLERTASVASPTLLDGRAVVPTAATLAVLAATVMFVAGAGATFAPLVGGSTGTVAEPGASHVVASQVDAGYATALRSQGVPASPVILAFATVEGRPLLVRGANFSAFRSVSDARLTQGRAPDGRAEAVVGADLATAYGIDIGETVLLGGSTTPAVRPVRVVGRYRAPGYLDDQLLVSLPAARHLTGISAGRVNAIQLDRRAFERASDAGESSAVVATDLSVPDVVGPDERVPVELRLRNVGTEAQSREVEVRFGDSVRRVSATIPPGGRTRVSVGFAAPTPGTYEVTAAGLAGTVTVREGSGSTNLALSEIPRRGPPNATLQFRVSEAGSPVPNATVTLAGTRMTTNAAGVARIRLPGAGRHVLRIQAGAASVTRRIAVDPASERRLVGNVEVRPASPGPLTRPEAVVRISNPWNRSVSREIAITAPGDPQPRSVTLAGGTDRTLRIPLGRAGTGTHRVTVESDGRPLAETTYQVRGDDRLVSAIASTGRYTPQSGLESGVASAFGNLELLLVAILVLAGAATVGAVGAGFATSVSACRETIGVRRATGATPLQVLRVVVGDAARIAALAAVPALVVAYLAVRAFGAFGLLTVFGVSIDPTPSLVVVAATGGAGVLLACVGATLVAVPLVRTAPAKLLRGESPDPGQPRRDHSEDEHGGGS